MSANLLRLAARNMVQRGLATSAVRQSEALTQADKDHMYPKLGNRDIVGFGFNGQPTYIDREEYPCPAVRFGENTSDVVALREKEKGDWKSLSLDEKKALYRASFCQTYAEMKAPTGEWKSITAIVIAALSLTGWIMIYLKQAVYPEMPHTITQEWKEDNLKRMVVERQGHVQGVGSMYDYENHKWK